MLQYGFRCGQEAAKELQVLASDPFNSRAAQVGLPVLRLLRTLTATCKATNDQVLFYCCFSHTCSFAPFQ